MSREAAYGALLSTLQTALKAPTGPFVIVEERMRPWASVNTAEYPALFLHIKPERITPSKYEPPIRVLTAELWVYVWTGEQPQVSKRAPLSALLDAIDAALAPDPITENNTLGGVVNRAWIEGMQDIREEVLSGAAAAFVSVVMEIPANPAGASHRFVFDSGSLYVTPPDGGAPVRIASLKDVTVEVARENVLHRVNTFTFPTKAGLGHMDLTCRARSAIFDAQEMIRLWLAATPSAGSVLTQDLERHTIPASSPYTVTVAPPNSGTWSEDLGAILSADGTVLARVSGTPSAGQYAVSAGTYTFHAAQAGLGVALSYLYTASSGTTLDLSQPTRGLAPTCTAVLSGQHAGKQVSLRLRSVVIDMASMPLAVDRFSVHDLKMHGTADAQDRVLTLSVQG